MALPAPTTPPAPHAPRVGRWRAFGRGVLWWLGTLLLLGGGTALLGAVLWVGLYWHYTDGFPIAKTVGEDRSLPYAEVLGQRLHAVSQGPGAPAPLVVGVPHLPWGDSRELAPLTALKDSAQVVLYDPRGRGLSARLAPGEASCQALGLDSLAAELAEVVRRHAPRPRPVWLVCQGQGWRVVQRLLAQRPHPDSLLHGGGVVLLGPNQEAEVPTAAFLMDQPQAALRLYYQPLHIRTLGDAHSRADHQAAQWLATLHALNHPSLGLNPRLPRPWRVGAQAGHCLLAQLGAAPLAGEPIFTGIRTLRVYGEASGAGAQVRVPLAGYHPLAENPQETLGLIRRWVLGP